MKSKVEAVEWETWSWVPQYTDMQTAYDALNTHVSAFAKRLFAVGPDKLVAKVKKPFEFIQNVQELSILAPHIDELMNTTAVVQSMLNSAFATRWETRGRKSKADDDGDTPVPKRRNGDRHGMEMKG